MKKLLSLVLCFPCLAIADNSGENCTKITDKDKRLECYDQIFVKPEKIDNTAVNVEEKLPTKWEVKYKTNPMDGTKSQSAIIFSDNKHSFAFPYDGEQNAALKLSDSGIRTSIEFHITKGQIICRDKCLFHIKIDDNQPTYVEGYKPRDGSTTYTYFLPEPELLRSIISAKKILVQPTIYQNGSPIFEFSTANNPYKAPTNYLPSELLTLLKQGQFPELIEGEKEGSKYENNFKSCVDGMYYLDKKSKKGDVYSKEDYDKTVRVFYVEEKNKDKVSLITYYSDSASKHICDKKENFFGRVSYSYK